MFPAETYNSVFLFKWGSEALPMTPVLPHCNHPLSQVSLTGFAQDQTAQRLWKFIPSKSINVIYLPNFQSVFLLVLSFKSNPKFVALVSFGWTFQMLMTHLQNCDSKTTAIIWVCVNMKGLLPPKLTAGEPKNPRLEDDFPFWKGWFFWFQPLVFRGVLLLVSNSKMIQIIKIRFQGPSNRSSSPQLEGLRGHLLWISAKGRIQWVALHELDVA